MNKSKNPFDDDDDHDDFGIALSDTYVNFATILIVMFVITVFMLLIHKGKYVIQETSLTVGSICAELSWPDTRDIDLDLWGRAPDETSIGFSNPHGQYLDLLRDITGFTNNPSHRNYETMCGKTLLPGDWTFNVSYYGKKDTEETKVPVEMTVYIKKQSSQTSKILRTAYVLDHISQEKTLFNFHLDENGNLLEDSVNSRNIEIVHGKN